MKLAEVQLVQLQGLAQRRAQLAVQAVKIQFDAKVAREYRQILEALAKENPEAIAAKLKDSQPLTRWAATMLIGQKRLHFEDRLLGLLSDPVPEVRQAARAALVRLSRGNDFGPLPKASPRQVAQSVQAWRWWHSQQEPPESIPEYLPTPQVAEADDSPGSEFEPLPRPQLVEADDARP